MTTATKDKASAALQRSEADKQNVQAEFCFEERPVVNPVPAFPSSIHLPGRVLVRLLQGRRYTHLDSWRELGHARLADSIWKLRKAGWPIEVIEESLVTSDAGRLASVGFYYLANEAISNAGQAGRDFVIEVFDAEKLRMAA